MLLSKAFGRRLAKRFHESPLGVTLTSSSDGSYYEEKSRSKFEVDEQPGVYHHLKPFLTLSTYLGLMPLTAVQSTKPSTSESSVIFRWLSLPTFLTIAVTSCLAGTGMMAFRYYFTTPAPKWGIEAIAVHPQKMVFFLVTPYVLMLSLRLAREFPSLIRQWDDAVTVLRKPIYSGGANPRMPIHMSRAEVAVVSGIFTALAVTEHLLHDISLGTCSNSDFLLCYYLSTPYVSAYLSYSKPLAIAIVVVEKFAMLAWNFPSLLVILVSLSLNANFRVISEYVQSKVTRNDFKTTVTKWKEIREDHLVLCRLMRYLDNALSPLTVMAFMINIYWNCIQAYSSLRPKARTDLEIIYFWSSFILLSLRLGGLTLAGTLLNEQANRPLQDLFYCPPISYTEEVVRFQTHISNQTLGFTGMNFFVIDRELLLTIIVLVLTYELILLDG